MTPLEISSKGATTMPYVKSLQINGRSTSKPIIRHDQIAKGGEINFQMSSQPEAWASGTLVSWFWFWHMGI